MEEKRLENTVIEEEKGFVALANELLEKCSIKDKISKLTDCKDEFFVSVYKGLIGDVLKGLIVNPVSVADHTNNCQCVIDAMAQEVLNVDLSHISAKEIIRGDTISIRNLLEIFAGLLEYFLECMDEDQSDSEGELDDSNVLTSQHEVISGLLQEEFGPSYQDVYRIEQRSKGQIPTSSSGHDSRKIESSALPVFDDMPSNMRYTRGDTRSKLNNLTSSGHVADTSEVSDSTNELIKLGETGSSISSLLDKRNETYNQPTRNKQPLRSDTWSHSTITDSGDSDDLTQYTLKSEEGQRDSSIASCNPSDNLSSSLVSSLFLSSWRKQISPLDSETDEAKLASLGVRPKVDNMAAGAAGKEDSESSGNGSGSGHATPVLHHHYHHHYHHPVSSDMKPQTDKTAISSGAHGDNACHYSVSPVSPGPSGVRGLHSSFGFGSQQLRHEWSSVHSCSNELPRVSAPDYSVPITSLPSHSKNTEIPRAVGPGVPSKSIPVTTVPLPDHSGPRTTLPSQSISTSLPAHKGPLQGNLSQRADISSSYSHIRDMPEYSGHRTTAPVHDVPMSHYSSLRSAMQGETDNLVPDSYTKRYGVPGEMMMSLSSTAPPLSQTVTDPLSSVGTGQLGSSGALSDSVFAVSGKPYMSSLEKSLGTRLGEKQEGRMDYIPQRSRLENVVTTDKPTTSKDAEETSETTKETSAPHRETKFMSGKDGKESDSDGNNSDDSDIARHSDSAIDYHRGDAAPDSDSESTEDSILRRIHERWKRIEAQPTSTSKLARRAVTFNDDAQVIPITSRMDRLRRLLEDEAKEQRQQHTTAMREAYADQLRDIQKQQDNERNEMKRRKLQRSPVIPKKKAKKPAPVKPRGRLEAIYRPQGRTPRPKKRPAVKTRKRSASASPDIGRRKVADFQEALLPSLFEEFPFLHVSPQTTHAMWQKQARQLSVLSKSETEARKSKVQRSVEEAEKRQERLLKILKKELETNQRMRDEREREDRKRAVKIKMNERRQIAARARRYYDDYQLRMRSKMLKRRTREEQIFKNLFQEGLEIQKQRVRELQKYAKEKRQALEQRQTNEIESLENYYKDQFAMLAEGMSRERNELRIRQQAQEKVMRQMRRELRQKMEKEIREFQENLKRDEDSAYFRQLEADRLQREFQLAMYKADL